jgi:hypothetical protein
MTLVFVSSVAVGLEPYRDAVHEAINCLDGYKSIRMEDFGAKNDAPLSVCLAKLYECEIFVGIVGHRYGSIAPETGKSFSETEYDEAMASCKTILMFLAPEEFPVPANLIESDELRKRQAAFRARVKQEHGLSFFDQDEEGKLAALVVEAIHNRRSEALAEGTIVQPDTITKLLYPFVTNQVGFDTAISISNISDDPFGTEKQHGTCTIHYYGNAVGGGMDLGSQVSNLVRAGETVVFTMSGGGTHLITLKSGFQGYIIVECRFRAAGFALVTGMMLDQHVSSSYLAQAIA